MKRKILLIDADILVFRYCWGNQRAIDWGNCTSEILDLDSAKDQANSFIDSMLTKNKCAEYLLCFTNPINFRYAVLPTYKHNRSGEKPKLLEPLKDYLFKYHPSKTVPELEADDVMGVLATAHPNRYVIATIDKDLKQIPGNHYNWNKGKRFKIELEEANRNFFRQVLTGDPTDGYSGIPNVGAKKAEQILQEVDCNNTERAWQVTLEAYLERGLTENQAITQARVARICRAEDYDFNTKRVRLWTPKGD